MVVLATVPLSTVLGIALVGLMWFLGIRKFVLKVQHDRASIRDERVKHELNRLMLEKLKRENKQ